MPTHDFWLFREGEYAHAAYRDFVTRSDAPVQIGDEALRYCADTLAWIPTLNPAKDDAPGRGLNWWGPTIIDQRGGDLLHRVCLSWAHLLSAGPPCLRLRGAFTWSWPFEEREYLVSEEQLGRLGYYEYLDVDRDELVRILTTLAAFGKQAATGTFFVLHLGI